MVDSLLSTLCILLSVLAPAPEGSINVRVAIVAYEDFHTELTRFEELFDDLSHQDPELHFQLTVGSYGEVLDWLDRGLVDIAVLTPGAFASRLSEQPSDDALRGCTYLATVQLPHAKSVWASPARREPGRFTSYHSVCLVAESSRLQNVDDLRTAAQDGQVEFLLVHPLSISGRVAPMQALREASIEPDISQIRYTYSHSQSLRILAQPDPKRERVAFVWDDAAGNDPQLAAGIRRLAFPGLDSMEIPHDVVVARVGFDAAQRLQQLLLQASGNEQYYQFTQMPEWIKRYGTIRDWLHSTGQTWSTADGEKISLDEIGQQLLGYARSQRKPPRLAVVLSGGGAKCSYQVGAVSALEDKLAELRENNPSSEIDIELVVGTSGGAINSLPVAMGISRTPSGQQALRATWQQLDQREIVRPSWLVRANMGVWFATLQFGVLLLLAKRFVQPVRHPRWLGTACIVLACIEFLLSYGPGVPWPWLGVSHFMHHAWLWVGFGLRISAWSLLVLGAGVLFLNRTNARRKPGIDIPAWLAKSALLSGLLGLPLLQLVTILTVEETLSSGRGMQNALADKFPQLINQHLSQLQLAKLDEDQGSDPAQRLQSVSRLIIERQLLRRDLVITGSCLSQTSADLPSDLYFFVSANSSTAAAPEFGERGLSLQEQPHILLDVVMGSGSIFPVFPARRIEGIPRLGEYIELVDGGFAHNSPVEAAVLWGATHIVLIEATPRQRSQRGNFLKNVTSSFQHLHRQAQLLDARSRGKVTIFSLSPEPPHMCVLDFASNLIDGSIRRGYRDANLSAASVDLRFRKELGEPIWLP